MPNITLLELRSSCKERANMENSSFVSDAEWNKYINYSIAELRDILISKVGDDYFAIDYDFTLVNGQASYTLPADFYKLVALRVKLVDGRFVQMRRFELNESPFDLRYRLKANAVIFSVTGQVGGTEVKLSYQPTLTKLVADAEILDGFNGWDEFVILKSARKALVKEEQGVTDIDAELIPLYARLEAMATNRDQAEPMRVQDVDSGISGPWYKLWS